MKETCHSECGKNSNPANEIEMRAWGHHHLPERGTRVGEYAEKEVPEERPTWSQDEEHQKLHVLALKRKKEIKRLI